MLKAYDIKERRVILERKLEDFLDLLIDTGENDSNFVVLTRKHIQVYNYDDSVQRMMLFHADTDFITRPLYTNIVNNFLSYGDRTSNLVMKVWKIDAKSKSIKKYLNIEEFANFADINGVENNIHNVVFYDGKFFVHSCLVDADENQGSFQSFNQIYCKNSFFGD